MTDKERETVWRLRQEGLGYGTIAKETGISIDTVKSFCRRNNVRLKAQEKPPVVYSGEVTLCENCGTEIHQIAKRKRKRFCCDKCRNEWWNSHLDLVKRRKIYNFQCPCCGKRFQVYGDNRRKYCSHACYIADRFGGNAQHMRSGDKV